MKQMSMQEIKSRKLLIQSLRDEADVTTRDQDMKWSISLKGLSFNF